MRYLPRVANQSCRRRLARTDVHRSGKRSIPGIPFRSRSGRHHPRGTAYPPPLCTQTDKDARPLREGPIDLEIGARGTFAPEIRTQFLFNDRLVGWPGLDIPFWQARAHARTICGLQPCRDVTGRECRRVGRRRVGEDRPQTDNTRWVSGCDADRASIGFGRARAAFLPWQQPR